MIIKFDEIALFYSPFEYFYKTLTAYNEDVSVFFVFQLAQHLHNSYLKHPK